MVIIALFVSVAVQPSIIADCSIESDNSELVEITVEIYEVNRVQEYTVMLTQEQAEELELLINNAKTELDAADNSDETKNIFMNTVESLNDLGLFTNGMDVEKVQRLITGDEQNPRIVKLFKRYYCKNQKSLDDGENTLCLIAGDTSNTIFIGPIPFLIALHCISLYGKYLRFLEWLQDNNPEFWSWWSENFGKLGLNLFFLRVFFWGYLGAGLNFCPIKFGAYMIFGWIEFGDEIPYFIPAEGWVNTIGPYDNFFWSGSFNGYVIGFTGIKIIRSFLDFFYLGAALKVHIECE